MIEQQGPAWSGPDKAGVEGTITDDRFALTIGPRSGEAAGYRWVTTFLGNPKLRRIGTAATEAAARRAAESAWRDLQPLAVAEASGPSPRPHRGRP